VEVDAGTRLDKLQAAVDGVDAIVRSLQQPLSDILQREAEVTHVPTLKEFDHLLQTGLHELHWGIRQSMVDQHDETLKMLKRIETVESLVSGFAGKLPLEQKVTHFEPMDTSGIELNLQSQLEKSISSFQQELAKSFTVMSVSQEELAKSIAADILEKLSDTLRDKVPPHGEAKQKPKTARFIEVPPSVGEERPGRPRSPSIPHIASEANLDHAYVEKMNKIAPKGQETSINDFTLEYKEKGTGS